MKKIIGDPDRVIEDYIAGLVAGSAHLARLAGWPVVVRSPETRKPRDRVAIVAGGGSGHEPAHAGYVGAGMLDAAVLGPVFTSPSVDAVLAAVRAVATDAGVLLVVKNYTGDRLNFGLAAELARAEGIRVETVLVADDAALGEGSRVGARGLTATVLAHKVAGASAERGSSLEEIAAVVRRLLAGAATMGVALGPCSVPGAEANFALGADEVEWGLGIHGEAGAERSGIVPAAAIAERLLDTVCSARGFAPGTEVVALVNGLGGTPDLELRILQGAVLAGLTRRGLRARMSWAGAFLTSLEMPGASLTVAAVDAELLELLAEETSVAAFPRTTPLLDPERVTELPAPADPVAAAVGTASASEVVLLHAAVAALAQALGDAEPELSALDRRVGDGDLGINLARGAAAVRAAGERLAGLPDPAAYLRALSEVLRREIGGTSGPLYSTLVLGLAESLRGVPHPGPQEWAEAAAHGVARVRRVGGAAPGDSTMVDALVPGVAALAAAAGPRERLAAAAAAARAGAEATAALTPSLGRSSYLGERAVGVPDPGAVAVAIQLEALAAHLGGGA
ncbi:dihydroxyacetone kinase family protein [Leucobacter allii]|uniref:dihydroxyacetone kinase family protein n=1 Tax=Leucobacter allii TaxID=2932247 RepID=UPI001FCFF8F9|nr:dihydroxyacetone kinase family protein [Leucobacter allii]UOR01830.1 dihydroxyacetone kinase family protein [Leucobacter allii]